jgi:hypothetical protein
VSSILLGLLSAAPAFAQVPPDTTTATPSDAPAPRPAPKPAAPPASPGRPTYQVLSQDAPPLTRLKLDNGFARWVNRREAPNTFYSVRAPMTVDIHEDWVMIRTEGGAVHVVPREFLIYVGSQSLDEF